MLHYTYASAFDTAKDVAAIFGTIIAVLGTLVGAYFAWRSRKAKKQEKEEQAQEKNAEQVGQLKLAVNKLQEKTDAYAEFKQQVQTSIQSLGEHLTQLRSKSGQQQSNLKAALRDLEQVTARLESLDNDLRTFHEKFLSVASYQSDLRMWTDTFNGFRANIRDINTILINRSRS